MPDQLPHSFSSLQIVTQPRNDAGGKQGSIADRQDPDRQSFFRELNQARQSRQSYDRPERWPDQRPDTRPGARPDPRADARADQRRVDQRSPDELSAPESDNRAPGRADVSAAGSRVTDREQADKRSAESSGAERLAGTTADGVQVADQRDALDRSPTHPVRPAGKTAADDLQAAPAVASPDLTDATPASALSVIQTLSMTGTDVDGQSLPSAKQPNSAQQSAESTRVSSSAAMSFLAGPDDALGAPATNDRQDRLTSVVGADGFAAAGITPATGVPGIDGRKSAAADARSGTGPVIGEVISQSELAGRFRQLPAGRTNERAGERHANQGILQPVIQGAEQKGLQAGAGVPPVAGSGMGSGAGRLANAAVLVEDSLGIGTSALPGTRVEVPQERLSGADARGTLSAVGAWSESTVAVNLSAALEEATGAQLTGAGNGRLPNGDLPATLVTSATTGEVSLMGTVDLRKMDAGRAAGNELPQLPAAAATGLSPSHVQSPDNMFLAVPGGIVTAPVVQQTDTGTAHIINAPLNVPLTKSDADAALAGNVRWMVNEGVQNAVVTVSPSGMGPISVKIGLDQDQLNVSIVATQGTTREALDALLPRLREQLASLGHDSVRVDVSDGRGDQSRAGSGQGNNDSRNTGSEGMLNTQDNDSSTSNREQAERSHPSPLPVDTQDSAPGELQRVASEAIGLAAGRPSFDAYV